MSMSILTRALSSSITRLFEGV